jgi:hypothetical protein
VLLLGNRIFRREMPMTGAIAIPVHKAKRLKFFKGGSFGLKKLGLGVNPAGRDELQVAF